MDVGRDELGEPRVPVESPVTFDDAVIHPTTGRSRVQQPSGDGSVERVVVFTQGRLRTSTGGSSEAADIVLYDPLDDGVNERYVVETSEPWVKASGHWRSFATLEEKP
jgi:hypothetical protein